jgi:peptidoglycan/xylan/chitin deacetylase (PgdA/CDA1 family)
MVTLLQISHGNPGVPRVALTFDDGPSVYTPQVLAMLQQYHVQATFFCIGRQIERFPSHVQQVLAGGHTIGNHTLTHPHLPTLSFSTIYAELSKTQQAVEEISGTCPTLFRPPYGEYNQDVVRAASQLGLTLVTWSAHAADWRMPQPSPASIATSILNSAENGAIFLLHEGGGQRANTVAALPAIIEGLQARGFELVTLPRLLADLSV